MRPKMMAHKGAPTPKMERFVTATKKATKAPILKRPAKAPSKALLKTSNIAKPAKTAVNSEGTIFTESTITLANKAKHTQKTPSEKAAIKRCSLFSPAEGPAQIAVL